MYKLQRPLLPHPLYVKRLNACDSLTMPVASNVMFCFSRSTACIRSCVCQRLLLASKLHWIDSSMVFLRGRWITGYYDRMFNYFGRCRLLQDVCLIPRMRLWHLRQCLKSLGMSKNHTYVVGTRCTMENGQETSLHSRSRRFSDTNTAQRPPSIISLPEMCTSTRVTKTFV